MLSFILAIICSVAVIIADQYSKIFVMTHYTLGESSKLLSGIIDLTYIHNRGGAWGMLSGYTWALLSITLVIMLVCIALLIKYGLKNKLIFWSISLMLAGGIGNMIDRIFRGGNVVDFLQFAFFKQFPVFNVADIAVCIGAGLLVLYFIIDTLQESIKKRKKLQENENEKI